MKKRGGDRLGRDRNPVERNPRNLPNIPKLTNMPAGWYRPVNRSGREKNTSRRLSGRGFFAGLGTRRKATRQAAPPPAGPTERALEPNFLGRMCAVRGGLQPKGPAWHATCIDKLWRPCAGLEQKKSSQCGQGSVKSATLAEQQPIQAFSPRPQRWPTGPLEGEIRREVLTAEQDRRQFPRVCSVLMSGKTATERIRRQVFGRDSGVDRR